MTTTTIALRGYSDPEPQGLERLLERVGGSTETCEQIVVFDERRTDGWHRMPRCVWTVFLEETEDQDLRESLRRAALRADAVHANADAAKSFRFEVQLHVRVPDEDNLPALHFEPDVVARFGRIEAGIDVDVQRIV